MLSKSRRGNVILYVIGFFVFASIVVCGMLGLFAMGNRNVANNEIYLRLNATSAIVQYPTIITRVTTLHDFEVMQKSLKIQVYYYNGDFYLIPTSLMGYIYSPEFNFSPFEPPQLLNP
jgi:hypothetical protein